jgi:hypothetical protein
VGGGFTWGATNTTTAAEVGLLHHSRVYQISYMDPALAVFS